MSRKIFTYTDLRDIKSCSFYELIKDCPQITVTTDLRKGINWYPRNKGGQLFTREVKDFKEVFSEICPEWNTPSKVFSQTVTVSEFFRLKIAEKSDDSKIKYYSGFKRNTAQVIKVINQLEEVCASCDDVRIAGKGNKDIETLCDAWEYLCKNNSTISEFHNSINNLRSKKSVDALINKLFGENRGNTIVIHGFYYISGIQEQVFRLLECAGYSLIFLFPYHEQYPTAMEVWDNAYDPKWGYVHKNNWIISGKPVYNVAGELLEDRFPETGLSTVSAIKYRSVIEFAQAMESAKKVSEIYSPNATQANQILKEFYPEKYGERRLLSYPVGQFLVSLHSMWNEEKENIVLDGQLLKECFASGWLSVGGYPSTTYLRDLELLLPYFERCESYGEWENRIDCLRRAYEVAVQPFYDNIRDISDIRVSETAGNPFSRFGFFSIEPNRLSDILNIIESLISIAKSLFLDTRKTSIASYMSKLEKLISSGISPEGKNDEEIVVVNDLMSAIAKLKHNNFSCYVDDIVAAMHLYLNRNDEDETSSRVGMVYPMSQIDAAIVKHNKRLHICMCDMDNMPGTEKAYEWPLNPQTVENYMNTVENDLFGLFFQNHVLAAKYNRYYFFSACNNSEVEFSWIETVNQKRSSPSPYISLMEICGLEIQSVSKSKINNSTVRNAKDAPKLLNFCNGVCCDSDIKDIRMEYALCPLRYLYGYVLDDFPKFSNSFQNGRAVGGLISSITKVMKARRFEKEQIARQVFALFPQFREIEKQQIFDYIAEIKYSKSLPDDYGEYEFTPERFDVSYPDSDLLDSVREKYSELSSQLARTGINLYESTDVKKACMFCPHESYCQNCIYSVDQEEYYGTK